MLAYDYPLLGIFWTMLWFFLFVIWLMLLFRVITDIFRSGDLGGFAKVLWLIAVIVFPFLGLLIYVIARGQSMATRELDRMKSQQQAFETYVRETAVSTGSTGGGSADELAKLADLRDRGVISAAEFEALKAKALA